MLLGVTVALPLLVVLTTAAATEHRAIQRCKSTCYRRQHIVIDVAELHGQSNTTIISEKRV
jgi:hypothetical protein